jgi:glycine/D-amino acid oxidase-like deaminating enzyme
LNDVPTSKGLKELKNKIDELINAEYIITDHKAAVRPAISDRRPVLGFHPENKTIGIFNGLGTKGAMLSPFYAKMLSDNIAENSIIDDEVNIRRFYK